jgi:hypothetical protein
MLGILIATYLIIGALASALIWMILIVSKRRENRVVSLKPARLESNLLGEANAEPSRPQP